jgi:DNA-cytosine methyltransferase
MQPINVLSLFDGLSGGQIALERAGIPIKAYYASEIDKYAIQITQKNYPKTIQLGDINCWREWNIPVPDLIIAGSPCQGFSNAGHGLNFDDPRSKLFFVFCDILEYYKDRHTDLKYMLENVKMKKEWQDVISDKLGLKPVLINSALVSAQNRQRLYWMNWNVEQPEDRHIYLKDIIEDGEVDREKSYTIDANYFKGGNPRSYFEDGRRQLVFSGAVIRNQVTKRGTEEQLNIRKDGKSNCIVPSYSAKLNGVVIRDKSNSLRVGGRNSPAQSRQVWDNIYWSREDYRGLTVLECERLQTVDEGYTAGVSNTQRYKMLGNGWTIDVVSHIFSYLR